MQALLADCGLIKSPSATTEDEISEVCREWCWLNESARWAVIERHRALCRFSPLPAQSPLQSALLNLDFFFLSYRREGLNFCWKGRNWQEGVALIYSPPPLLLLLTEEPFTKGSFSRESRVRNAEPVSNFLLNMASLTHTIPLRLLKDWLSPSLYIMWCLRLFPLLSLSFSHALSSLSLFFFVFHTLFPLSAFAFCKPHRYSFEVQAFWFTSLCKLSVAGQSVRPSEHWWWKNTAVLQQMETLQTFS